MSLDFSWDLPTFLGDAFIGYTGRFKGIVKLNQTFYAGIIFFHELQMFWGVVAKNDG